MLSPCESVRVESWWLTQSQPAANYNMQITMIAPDGTGITDANAPLSTVETRIWEMNRFAFDARTLMVPCDTPAGEYPLILGVYNPETLTPLTITDTNGEGVGNQVYLTTLFVE